MLDIDSIAKQFSLIDHPIWHDFHRRQLGLVHRAQAQMVSLPHIVALPWPEQGGGHYDRTRWCKRQFKCSQSEGRWRRVRFGLGCSGPGATDVRQADAWWDVYHFRDHADAVLFKLTFTGE
ncbi:hypothetical protein BKE38_08635 [Pseudoroseomonas deserti]|uniref:Uncharacterized protein n=1 Tax=Teichococcus deserti TaxID=1817963 RepID=A0A1V2H6G7_9PROT|nr:hypothetical protein [Pseudoroseomonas deserti]ONG55723.1 hypothetical protein BKE38_08635 [Pseudoroseomonas deserti]